MEGKFTSKDTEKLVEFLNFVATNAEFTRLDVKKVLRFSHLLAWAQADLLHKVESHKFEVVAITPAKPRKSK